MRILKNTLLLTILVGFLSSLPAAAQEGDELQSLATDTELLEIEQAAIDAATETENENPEEILKSESIDVNAQESFTTEVSAAALSTTETTESTESTEITETTSAPAPTSTPVASINQELGLSEIILDSDEDQYDFYAQKNLTAEHNQRQRDLYHLQKAKFKLINGDLTQAEFFLNRIDDKKSVLVNVKKRYMAMIYFLNNQFTKSLEMLNHPTVRVANYNKDVCLLRLINYIALNDIENLKREYNMCQVQTSKYSKNNQQWLDNLIDVKLSKDIGVGKNLTKNVELVFLNEDISRLWLKTGLFLNKESEFVKLISKLPANSYQSRQLREIIAFMYFRLKQYDKAMSFIDDIDSANAENIKGNIRLVNKEYELAFGHFRLALQKKQDSVNALERAIPLSWMLGQWDDGLKMLDNISHSKVDKKNKDALKVAFLIRKDDLLSAQKELRALKKKFDDNAPFEINLMESYVNLILEKDVLRSSLVEEKRKTEEAIEKSCRSFDGISCWLAMQYLEYDNLSKTLQRKDTITSENSLSIDDLKKSVAIVPLDEEATIDQSDVEELDGKQIKITP